MTTIRVVMGIKEGRIVVNKTTDLRQQIKNLFKLQVPKECIKFRRRGQEVEEDETQIIKQLKLADCLEFYVAEFEIGEFICTGEEIGSGAFSQVYKGHRKSNREIVAIKVVDYQQLTGKEKIYHERERTILKSLQHENIVEVHQIVEKQFKEGLYYFFVMEYCRGGNLGSYIKNVSLPEEIAKRFLSQIANALIFLEEKSILHRDLKPQNILLTSPNLEEAIAKICDFGFSRHYSQEDLIQSFPSTPLYAAPEILNHQPYLSNQGDLWSLGLIFWEMLHGKHPFSVSSREELDIAHKEARNLKSRKDLSPYCADLLKRMIEKDRSKRMSLRDLFEHPFMSFKTIFSVPGGRDISLNDLKSSGERKPLTLKNRICHLMGIPKKNLFLLLQNGEELTDEFGELPSIPLFAYSIDRTDYSSLNTQPIIIDSSALQVNSNLPINKRIENYLQIQQTIVDLYNKAYQRYQSNILLLQLQSQGLTILLTHLKKQFEGLNEDYLYMIDIFSRSQPAIDQVKTKFNTVIEEMRSIQLDKAFMTSTRKTLLDCINHKEVKEKYEDFISSNLEIRNYLKLIDSLKGTEFVQPTLVETEFLPPKSDILATYKQEIRNFIENVNQKKNNYLPFEDIQQIENYIKESQRYLDEINHQNEKLKPNETLHSQLLLALEVKAKVIHLKENSSIQKKQLLNHHSLLQKLYNVVEMPNTYNAYLLEISRSSKFQNSLRQKLESLSTAIHEIEEKENERIRSFRETYEEILPTNIFPKIPSNDKKVEIIIPPKNDPPVVTESLDSSDEDFVLIEDPVDLKKENQILRLELNKLAFQPPPSSMIEPLKKIHLLESRLQNMDNHLNEYETRFKETLSQIEKLKLEENNLRRLLDQAREEKAKFEKQNRAPTTNEELTKIKELFFLEKNKTKNLEKRIGEMQETLDLQSSIIEEHTQTIENLEEKLLKEKKKYRTNLDTLLKKTNYFECPLCAQFFPQDELKHFDECLKDSKI